MEKNIRITDTRTGGAIYPDYVINLGAVNYVPQDNEFFKLAWRCAVEDGFVESEDLPHYKFSIV